MKFKRKKTYIFIFCTLLIIGSFSGCSLNNITTSRLEKIGTFVTLKQESDGLYYCVEISGSAKHGPAVYEFNNGYLLEKDDENQNVEDSYTVSVIDESTFVVRDEDEFEDTTLTIVNYDSSTGVLELSEDGDTIYCYPYDKVDLENTVYEHDGMYVFQRYYVNLVDKNQNEDLLLSKKIIGQWQSKDNAAGFYFKTNGSCENYVLNFSFTCQWKIEENKLIIINNETEYSETYNIEITNGTMKMIDEKGNEEEYAKTDKLELKSLSDFNK